MAIMQESEMLCVSATFHWWI